jgi:hypothetical protein
MMRAMDEPMIFFATGLPPLSIAFNGNTKFKRQYNEEKGVGRREASW